MVTNFQGYTPTLICKETIAGNAEVSQSYVDPKELQEYSTNEKRPVCNQGCASINHKQRIYAENAVKESKEVEWKYKHCDFDLLTLHDSILDTVQNLGR